MSHKIAKAVRKSLRLQGVDVNEKVYKRTGDGNISLLPGSGRAIYQVEKKLQRVSA